VRNAESRPKREQRWTLGEWFSGGSSREAHTFRVTPPPAGLV